MYLQRVPAILYVTVSLLINGIRSLEVVRSKTATIVCGIAGTYVSPSWDDGTSGTVYIAEGQSSFNPSTTDTGRWSRSSDTKNLIISSIVDSDAGTYRCSITTPTIKSDTTTLTVTNPTGPLTTTTTTIPPTTTTERTTASTTLPTSTTTTRTSTTTEITATPSATTKEAITITEPTITSRTTDSNATTAVVSNEKTVIIVVASTVGGVLLVGLVVLLVCLFLYRGRRSGHGKRKHNHKRTIREQHPGSAYIYSGPSNGHSMEMYPSMASYIDTRHGYPHSIKAYSDRRLRVDHQKQANGRHEGSQMRNTSNAYNYWQYTPRPC